MLDFVAWISKRRRRRQNLIESTQTIALINMLQSKDDAEIDAVKMSTLHASKGLEYGHVFLVGCEEGILPTANRSTTAWSKKNAA